VSVAGWYAGRERRIEQRQRVGEFAAGEIAVPGEALVELVPADPRPVVEALQRQVNVFVGLEFQDGQTARRGCR